MHVAKKSLKSKNANNYLTLVIQFEHCIGTASLNSGKFKIQSQSPEMLRRTQVRGYKEDVIFAEYHVDCTKIFKLEINDKNLQETVKTEIFEFNKHIVTMQRAA